ncbi:gamma-secretase subunit APH-1B isoform 2, partial [Daubentonia madagascariensis]
MTAAVFFGCAFIAFGPALALYIFTIATDSLRIIFLIAGAFFWLVSLLFSSLVWFVARAITDSRDGPIQKYLLIFGVLVSVFIQELFRFAYYRLLKKANEGLKSVNPGETAPSMQLLAYDLHKSSLWNKSGVSIYNHGAHGHLGILCCWRQLPNPETLPALPRQGLSSLQPALQI